MKSRSKFIEEVLKIKKARLIEHNLSFEDLIIEENFSGDEQTLEYKKSRVLMT
jgi:hypothetical protein